MKHLLASLASDIDQVVLSISMESIEGVPGVSKPCMSGITTEEAVGLCLESAYHSSHVVAVDVSDYNPFIED